MLRGRPMLYKKLSCRIARSAYKLASAGHFQLQAEKRLTTCRSAVKGRSLLFEHW